MKRDLKINNKEKDHVFNKLKEINKRPKPFEMYTANNLWTDEYRAGQMLKYHLNESIDVSSRKKAFIEKSTQWIIKHFKINDQSTVADFGCGPGLYSIRLAAAGVQVTAIDFSENSINYAKKAAEKKGLHINYIHQNYLNFETGQKYDLIIMIMCDFCALSPEQRSKILKKFHTMLKPGGTVLLDVHTLNFYNQREETAYYEHNQLNQFWSPNDYYCFVNTFKYDREKVSLDKYTVIEKNDTYVIYNWLQAFSQETLQEEFENEGFRIEAFYADVAGNDFQQDSDEMAVVAKKK